MAGREKIKVTHYNSKFKVVAEYENTRMFLVSVYDTTNYPLWNKNSNIHIIKDNGGYATRNGISIEQLKEFVKSYIHKKIKKYVDKHKLTVSSYRAMVSRCNKVTGDPFYLKNGIIVCERWLKSYDDFESDMGYRPSQIYSIDRIDPTKGYYKGNCRWATREQQANNKMNNIKIVMALSDFSKIVGVTGSLITYHMKSGRTPKEVYFLLNKDREHKERQTTHNFRKQNFRNY